MTLAELQSTVTHALQKAAEANVPPHKVQVKVDIGSEGRRLDLYPGCVQCQGDNPLLILEAE